MDDDIVDAILHVGALIRGAKEPGLVGFVLSEQQRDPTLAIEGIVFERFLEQGVGMVRVDHPVSHTLDRLQDRLRAAIRPGPGITEPQGRQHVQQSGFKPAIVDADPDQHVFRGCLGILDDDVEIAVVVEDASVEELVLELVPRAPPIRRPEVSVGISRLGVLVQVLHVGVGRRVVEVEIVLLRSEEHTSELQSLRHLVCRLLLEKKKKKHTRKQHNTKNTSNRKQISTTAPAKANRMLPANRHTYPAEPPWPIQSTADKYTSHCHI